ncbi:MAG: O-antigen ligase family protein, partial [Planctomycetota bacterium]
WGLQNGGNGKVGLWILRPVVYFVLTAFVTYQLVRTPRQAKWLLMAMLVCIGIRAAATMVLWWQQRGTGVYHESYVAHENTSFALYLVWMAFGAFMLKISKPLGTLVFLLLPITLLAVMFNDRRINFVTLVLGCVVMVVAMPRLALARRTIWLMAGTVALMLYLAAAVVLPVNGLTRPVDGILTGLRSEVRGHYTDSSSEYRKQERYNLIHTIRAYPLMGAGLGVAYLQPIPLPDLGYAYSKLIPHNQVLGTHALMGPQGYFMLLLFHIALLVQMLSCYRRLKTDWHRLLALVAACSVINWLVVGYYDIQLFYFRNNLFMAVVVALPAALMHWQEEQEHRDHGLVLFQPRQQASDRFLA